MPRSSDPPHLHVLEERCKGIGGAINEALASYDATTPDAPRTGYVLWMFTLGDGGWMTYVSNAKREDSIRALREFIAKAEPESGNAIRNVVAYWDSLDAIASDDERPTEDFRDEMDRRIDQLRKWLPEEGG